MASAATSFDTLADFRNELIRKHLKGAVFLAEDSVAIPASFTAGATADLQMLPDGFESLGKLSVDGAPKYTPEIKTSEIESFGDLESSREDIISRNTTIELTSHETRRKTLELYTGVDLSKVTPDATTGELRFAEPTTPATKFYRYLHLGVDGAGDRAIYIWRIAPRFQITGVGAQQATKDGAMAYPLTGKAKVDSAAGYAIAWAFGGPGWKPLLAKMGWTDTANPVRTSEENKQR
ncbi:hypothetical protein IU500_12425 [Nocardia terpenica]|uniref:phage tail tube protein n=1 Tax=Nocardia terpenica TaxID=455432 RepID=UPI00189510E0|nr:hypothetical protein [Nocardia terpenica]MBF6063017.1 hypothetical protein [Nocardia terpenica]MBF6104848.1 hypothetical protein [Nocardia terpenica]MBF6112715.1 hypothetical protein [Nocardia terpenica]MBF6118576.1 hypothetical protein [Nocardia terpenica]MBF6155055.1 hypothetical protein [Nocardia terpenica]